MKTVSVTDLLSSLEDAQKGRSFDYSSLPTGTIDEVIKAWQISLSSGKTPSSELGSALALAVEFCLASVLKTVYSEGKGRGNGDWVSSNIDDIRSDARLWILEKFKIYRTEGGNNAPGYIMKNAQTEFLRDMRDAYASPGVIDQAWVIVRAAYHFERNAYHEANGKYPNREEIENLITNNLTSRRIAFVKAQNPSAPKAALVIDAKAYLVKQGYTKAITELDAIMALGLSDLRLDQEVSDGEGTTYSSSIKYSEEITDNESPLDQIYMLALGTDQWARPALAASNGLLGEIEGTSTINDESCHTAKEFSFTKFSKEVGIEKPIVKLVLHNAAKRIASPHAQFAHFAKPFRILEPTINDLNGYSANDFS
jgi:hypothetical protein